MKRIITTAFLNLVLVGTLASVASANFTYNVSLSAPNDQQGSAGPVSVNGTITVDMLGTLTASDIVDYSLTFTSPDNPATTLTPSNGVSVLNLATLTANVASLKVTLTPGFGGDISLFAIQTNGTSDLNADFQFLNEGSDRFEIFVFPLSGSSNGGITELGGNGGTYTVGTAPSVVPEPSSLVLAGLGTVMGMGYLGMKRRRTRTA